MWWLLACPTNSQVITACRGQAGTSLSGIGFPLQVCELQRYGGCLSGTRQMPVVECVSPCFSMCVSLLNADASAFLSTHCVSLSLSPSVSLPSCSPLFCVSSSFHLLPISPYTHTCPRWAPFVLVPHPLPSNHPPNQPIGIHSNRQPKDATIHLPFVLCISATCMWMLQLQVLRLGYFCLQLIHCVVGSREEKLSGKSHKKKAFYAYSSTPQHTHTHTTFKDNKISYSSVW